MENSINLFDCHPLFDAVQMNGVFEDGKTFVDCVPKEPLEKISAHYLVQKDQPNFNLKEFVLTHFDLPPVFASGFTSDASKTIEENIQQLWPVLTRQPDEKQGSLIPLPYPYIVPGGRFGEVYYWDSYFTMPGLKESGMLQLIENMIDNFAHLISTVGYIPNGNRTYYIGRSQPPFFALMIQLLAGIKGKEILMRYLPSLETEYHFWMKGAGELDDDTSVSKQVVRMPEGELLNRYFDENNMPRPESYKEDVELSHQSSQPAAQLYSHLRAGAASGWDYSSRWFKDGTSFATIHTTEIIPVDLNCLLFFIEQTIAEAFYISGDMAGEKKYLLLAEKRKTAIQKYCWNSETGFFCDYNLATKKVNSNITAAGLFPLFVKITNSEQAAKVEAATRQFLLKDGGIVTTTKNTGQQWDAPNGWAPLQWIAYIGLNNYNHEALANKIAHCWVKLNEKVFNDTGKMMEKYNVENLDVPAGGGEYPGQDGFGWTNGVYLALKKKLSLS